MELLCLQLRGIVLLTDRMFQIELVEFSKNSILKILKIINNKQTDQQTVTLLIKIKYILSMKEHKIDLKNS